MLYMHMYAIRIHLCIHFDNLAAWLAIGSYSYITKLIILLPSMHVSFIATGYIILYYCDWVGSLCFIVMTAF